MKLLNSKFLLIAVFLLGLALGTIITLLLIKARSSDYSKSDSAYNSTKIVPQHKKIILEGSLSDIEKFFISPTIIHPTDIDAISAYGYGPTPFISRLNIPAEKKLLRINIFNGSGYYSASEENKGYFVYQVVYPADYYVFRNEMFESFHTQGGGGPVMPSLFLTKDPSLFDNTKEGWVSYDYLTQNSDCLIIYNKEPDIHTSLDTFRSSYGEFRELDQKYLQIGYFNFKLGEIEYIRFMNSNTNTNKKIYDAYFEEPGKVIYYFQTCNKNNLEDFMILLQYFDIRPYRQGGG